MEKKDIYEHLARIYLDASQKKGKKPRTPFRLFRNLFFISIAVILGLNLALFAHFSRKKSLPSETSLVLLPQVARINFNFDPAKKEIHSLDLKGIDLTKFKTLALSLKKENFKDRVYLRIEFVNAFKEKSELYLKDLTTRWKGYRINLADFKNISDWSKMLSLNFIVEEWNATGEKVLVYIDDVSLIK